MLGISSSSGGNAGFVSDMMMDSSSPFVEQQPMTRDLLGLSIGGAVGGAGDRRGGGLSALLSSFGGRFDNVADTSSGRRSSPAAD